VISLATCESFLNKPLIYLIIIILHFKVVSVTTSGSALFQLVVYTNSVLREEFLVGFTM